MPAIRVLLADDNPVFRRGLRRFLEADGRFRVVDECGDGMSTILAARRLHPDILLVDVRMPLADGLEVAKELREFYPHIHIVILTEYESAQYRQDAREIGCDGYLLKSLPAADILTYLLQVASTPSSNTPEVDTFMGEIPY